jgi:hypothetical protein
VEKNRKMKSSANEQSSTSTNSALYESDKNVPPAGPSSRRNQISVPLENFEGLKYELEEARHEIECLRKGHDRSAKLQIIIEDQKDQLDQLHLKVANLQKTEDHHRAMERRPNDNTNIKSYLAGVEANLQELVRQNDKLDKDYGAIESQAAAI